MIIPNLDTPWVLVCASMVFIMQVGFLALEAGLTRTKNAINVAIKNVTDFSVSLLVFWAVGFGLIFGPSVGGIIGLGGPMPSNGDLGEKGTAFLLFQGMFCGTAVTIVAGAIAERTRFAGYLAISMLVCLLIYPLSAHWAWGGTTGDQQGWLRAMGFVDFAGSTVVHGVGGAVALAAVLVVGPRLGRFTEAGAQRVPPSSLPMAMLGVLLLSFGWIGFNGGSNLTMDGAVPSIILNTMLAGSAGLVAALVVGWSLERYADPALIICGALGGLVAVTAGCHSYSFGASILVGASGGLVAIGSRALLERIRVDDAVDAIPVHLACGVWGTLAVALAMPSSALPDGVGRLEQFGIQALGTGSIVGATFVLTYGFLRLFNAIFRLRVSSEDEAVGLNVAEHRAPDDLQDLLSAMDEQARTSDLSRRVPVEAFTEVGRIASRYNVLMASLEGSLTSISNLEAANAKVEEARLNALDALRAKTSFLANMSDELRSPLSGIIGFTDLLQTDAEALNEPDEYLGYIRTSGQYLLHIIDEILDLSRLEAGKSKIEHGVVEPRPLLNECVAQFVPRALQSGLTLDLEIDPEVPHTVIADRKRVKQVLGHIIGNAIKFTEKGGIVVELCSRRDITSRIEIRVTDTGAGIPADQHEHIFEAFTLIHDHDRREHGGTGLGLALARSIARHLGGDVAVESAPGEGATFIFSFPIAGSARVAA